MRTLLALPLALAAVVRVGAQKDDRHFPVFDEYPAVNRFKGKPASPKLARPADRLFRTKIREGAAAGPNFAGHFSIADWGCGTSCVSIAVIDAETGNVYPGPFGILGYGSVLNYASESNYKPLSFTLNSRLLIVRGCPEDENCASYYYEWEGSSFRLLRKIPTTPIRLLRKIPTTPIPH